LAVSSTKGHLVATRRRLTFGLNHCTPSTHNSLAGLHG